MICYWIILPDKELECNRPWQIYWGIILRWTPLTMADLNKLIVIMTLLIIRAQTALWSTVGYLKMPTIITISHGLRLVLWKTVSAASDWKFPKWIKVHPVHPRVWASFGPYTYCTNHLQTWSSNSVCSPNQLFHFHEMPRSQWQFFSFVSSISDSRWFLQSERQ